MGAIMGAGVVGVLIFAVIGGLIYAVIGWIITAIMVALYNFIAGRIGGLQVDVTDRGADARIRGPDRVRLSRGIPGAARTAAGSRERPAAGPALGMGPAVGLIPASGAAPPGPSRPGLIRTIEWRGESHPCWRAAEASPNPTRAPIGGQGTWLAPDEEPVPAGTSVSDETPPSDAPARGRARLDAGSARPSRTCPQARRWHPRRSPPRSRRDARPARRRSRATSTPSRHGPSRPPTARS